MAQNDIDDALIHLRVPREVKGRWVALSRSDGKRLTDWITEALEFVIEQRGLAPTTSSPDKAAQPGGIQPDGPASGGSAG
jgi:hypothetical protein